MIRPLADSAQERIAVTMSTSVINGIKLDMENNWIPRSVKSFAELHNHTDANEYLLTALERQNIVHDPASDSQAALVNRVMDIVNVWLGARP